MRQLQIHNKPTYRSNILKPFLDKIGKYDVLEAIQEVALSKIIKGETLTSEEEDSLKGLVHGKQYRDIFIIKEKKELLATLNGDTKKQNNSETADNIKKGNNLGITEQQAIQVLTVCNLRFVVSVAKQYTNRPGADLSELIEEGTIGLTKAATRFDATRGFKFISYAVRWIRQKILQSLSENEFIRKPANQTALNKKIWKFEEQFIQKEGRLPSKEEIETELEITEKQYENYLSAYLTENIGSLDATFGDDDERTLGDIIPNNTPSPASLIEQNTDRSGLAKFLEQRLNSDKDTQQYKQAFACALKFGLNPGGVNPDGVGIERADGEIVEIFHKKGISIIDEKYIEKCQKKGILIKTDIETEIELVQTLITNAKRKLSKRVKPDGDVKDNYLVKHISKSDIDISIPDIVLKASEEEIKQALNRLSEKKGTETQAKVLSLRYGIPSKFNPDGKKHTIKEIAGQIERREGSVKTTLISAIEKLEIVLSQPKIIFQPQSSTPSSNDIPQSKILTDPQKDVSDVDYRRSLIEEALIRLEKKTTEREKGPEIFRLYYGLNDNGKVRDVEAIMGKTEKKYPALMAAKKRTEKAILGILEGVNPIKMADILKKLRKSNTAATKDVLKEPKKDINNSKTSPETGSKNSGSNDIGNDKVYAEPRDASEVDYWKGKIEEALIILENKIKKTIGLRIFRLYYGLNDNGKPYDGHTIAETEVKKPYTTTMHIRKGIEKKILDTIEGINSSKLNKILENLKQSYRTTIIVDKTRDVSDVKYRRSQIEKALNLLKQEQESERKKGNRKIDRCKVFNLYYNSVNPDDGKLYTAKKIAKKERISGDSYVTHILENTKKEIRYKLGIDSFTMDEILKNLRKSNNAGIKQVLEEPQPETQDIPKNINDSAPKEPEKESPEAQNIPQSEIPTDPQKDASIPTKITDIPDVIDLESKIKTALEELRQEIENERGKGKSNRQRNGCDVLNLYYFSVNPGDGKLYSNDKIANQLGISAGTYVSTILKKTKTRLAEKLGIDTDTLADILKNLRERNGDTIKQVLEEPEKESPEAQNIPQSEIPTDPQKDASIPTKITDIPDVIDLESKIKTALEELRQEIENEDGRGKSNRQRNGCDVLNLYYFSVNPDDGKLYSNDKIANQLGISAGTYVSTILKKTKTRLAEKLLIDTDTLDEILKKLRKSNNADIKQVLEEPEKESPEAQNIPQSEIPTDPQKDASIPTKITDIPDVIDLESKIKTALEELRQEIENEQGRGKSNRQRNGCDVLNLYYFSVNPGDGKLYSNDKIANQLGISAGTYVSTILKKTKTRLAEKLGIDTDTLADILKNLRERNRDSIKNILEQPHKNTENLKQ